MYRCDRSYTEPSYICPRYTLADSSMIYYTSLRDRIFILGDFFFTLSDLFNIDPSVIVSYNVRSRFGSSKLFRIFPISNFSNPID